MPTVKPYTFAELFPLVRAGAAWDFDATGALVQAAPNTPRVDYDPVSLAVRGVLFEQGGTNVVRNPAAEPGSGNPTHWTLTLGTSTGVTRSLLGHGVIGGVRYIDYSLVGTATAGNVILLLWDAVGAIPAVNGQTWAQSVRLAYLQGDPAQLSIVPALRMSDSVGTVVGGGGVLGSAFVPGAALAEFVHVGTLNQATVASIQPGLRVSFNTGAVLNHILRIAIPQAWLSAVAFSPTLPPSGQTATSIRAADDCAATAPGRWFNPAGGTFVVEVTPGQAAAGDLRGILSIDDGTAANRIALRLLAGNTNARASVDIGGAQVAAADQATGAALVRHTLRFSYGPAGLLLSVNGAAPVVAASAVPAGLSRVLLGRAATAAQYLNGWIGPRFEYYPAQYTDTPAGDGFTIRTR